MKSALFARNYHIFGMLFIPKTIINFNFYLVIFGVLYVVKLKLALEILACPIRASIFCRCSKMLARFQLLLAPGNRASAYVAPCWVLRASALSINELTSFFPFHKTAIPLASRRQFLMKAQKRLRSLWSESNTVVEKYSCLAVLSCF